MHRNPLRQHLADSRFSALRQEPQRRSWNRRRRRNLGEFSVKMVLAKLNWMELALTFASLNADVQCVLLYRLRTALLLLPGRNLDVLDSSQGNDDLDNFNQVPLHLQRVR